MPLAWELASGKGYKQVELQVTLNDLNSAVARLELDQVPELEDRLVKLEAELGPAPLDRASLLRATWHLWLGEISDARQWAETLVQLLRRTRSSTYLWVPLRTLGTSLFLRGEFAEVPRALGLEERTDKSAPDTYMEMARAVLAETRGDLDEARAAVHAAIQVSTFLRTTAATLQYSTYLAGIERRAGNRPLAARLYREVTQEWDRFRGNQLPIFSVILRPFFAL